MNDELIPAWVFGGVRFEVRMARTAIDKETCYRLRYDYFCLAHDGDVPQFDASAYPDGLESDEFDDRSIQLLAEMVTDEGRSPVGTFRLIPCELGYYIEGADFGGIPFNLPKEHDGLPVTAETTFEAGRWCGKAIQLPDDGRRVLVSMMLAEAGLEISKQLGRTHWVCGLKLKVTKGIIADGWPVSQIVSGISMRWNSPVEAVIIPLGRYDLKCRRIVPATAA